MLHENQFCANINTKQEMFVFFILFEVPCTTDIIRTTKKEISKTYICISVHLGAAINCQQSRGEGFEKV